MEPEKIPIEVAVKYLSGEASPEEAMQFDDLLDDPAAGVAFEQISETWNLVTGTNPCQSPLIDEAFDEFQRSVKGRSSIYRMMQKKYFVAAAVIIVAISVAWIFFMNDSNHTQQLLVKHNSTNHVQHDSLPDGSLAVLNMNSTISYPSFFDKNIRRVNLEGESFFEVVPDKQRPFEIEFGEVIIRVVGTSFNVREINDKTITEVQVRSGIVQMFANDKNIFVKAGQTGYYNSLSKKLFATNSTDINSFSYATGKFIFNDIPFTIACRYLEKNFNRRINVDQHIFEDCHVTAEFENKSLDYILEVLCATLNATYSIKDNAVFIKGKSKNKLCGEQPFLR
ncbi:MAG: FecR family protein [Chitinophagaceae bacterium]|nr:FecR family protein [Chitinophagaceae bacterium]